MKYRKKPVVIEAIQWNGANLEELKNFVGSSLDWGMVTLYGFTNKQMLRVVIHTLEGDHEAKVGDYIIKGVQGEFYPCKPEIFAKTYEAVEEYPTCNESARRDMELSRKTHREF